jgi:MSHA biogenesis protein MshQ
MAWYNTSWNYRVKVTVLASKVDADLTDFPVYVDLNDLPAGFHTNCNQTDARDIRVTTSDGETEVPREVVFYTAASDTGELHFKGNIDSDTDTDFYIYYGNADATEPAVDATYGRNNVWTNNYNAVLHLQEGGTTSTGAYKDSSGHYTGGGTGVADVATNASAQIGVGTTFDGTGDYIEVGANSIDATDAFTLSCWLNTDTVGKYSGAVSIGATGIGNSAYIGTVLTAQVGTSNSIGGGFYGSNYGSGITTTGSWKYVQMTFAGGASGAVKIYVDGIEKVNTTSTPGIDVGYTRIGRITTDTLYDFDGSIDEVRVISAEKLVTWLLTEFNNQSDAGAFFTIGDEETSDGNVGTIGPFPVFFNS